MKDPVITPPRGTAHGRRSFSASMALAVAMSCGGGFGMSPLADFGGGYQPPLAPEPTRPDPPMGVASWDDFYIEKARIKRERRNRNK